MSDTGERFCMTVGCLVLVTGGMIIGVLYGAHVGNTDRAECRKEGYIQALIDQQKGLVPKYK